MKSGKTVWLWDSIRFLAARAPGGAPAQLSASEEYRAVTANRHRQAPVFPPGWRKMSGVRLPRALFDAGGIHEGRFGRPVWIPRRSPGARRKRAIRAPLSTNGEGGRPVERSGARQFAVRDLSQVVGI